MVKTKSNVITARVWGTCDTSAPVLKCKTFKLQEGGATTKPPPGSKQNAEPVPVQVPNPNQ